MAAKDDAVIEVAILTLAGERGIEKTFCPSEAARAAGEALGRDWNTLMTPLRRVAVRLATEGKLLILRKGKPVDPTDFKGVYRLRQP